MRSPTINDALGTYLDCGEYSDAAVSADSRTSSLASIIEEPQADLIQARDARNAARNAEMKAEALRDFQVNQMNDVIMDLSRKAVAHFGSRTDTGFVRLFRRLPSEITGTPDRDRLLVYGQFVEVAQADETPAALATTVRALVAAWKKVQAAEAALAKADVVHDQAVAAVKVARQKWLEGYLRLYAEILARFMGKRREAERYFRKLGEGKTRKAEAPAEREEAA